MRMKTRIGKQQAARQAAFILANPDAFREPRPAVPVAVDPEYRPTSPPAWGAMPGQSDLGNG